MGRVGDLRTEVLARDGGCVAPLLDPDAGPCRNRWGYVTPLPQEWDLEMDYVRRGHHGAHHQLAADHITLCPGHHRGTGAQGGRIWASQPQNRVLARAYLDRCDLA